LPDDVKPDDLPTPPSPDMTPPPPPPTGWEPSQDSDLMRAGHTAAMARRRRGAPSSGSEFVPAPPPRQPPIAAADDDGLVARMYADRQRFEAAWQGQPQGMPETLRALSGVSAGNIVNVPPQDPAEQTTPPPVVHSGVPPQDHAEQTTPEAVALSGRVTLQSKGAGAATLQVAGPAEAEATLRGEGTVAANARIIERSISERPADIRDAARALVKEIKDQVEQLKNSKPNDEAGLAKHNEFVEFLERIAAGLAELADALDQAVKAGPDGPPEPMFLGKAAWIAEQLNIGLMEWLEANRANVAGFTVRIGLIGTGYLFLHACGLDDRIAAIVSSLANRGFSNKKTNTTRAKKRAAKS
jgi:hypothetical protein